MKRIGFMVFASVVACLAQDDVLHLKSGESAKGTIVSLNAVAIDFRVIIDGPRGRGEARRRVLRKDVDFIDFAQTEAEIAIAEGETIADELTLQRLWARHSEHLAEANSPAGVFGLLLVEKWLTETQAEKAAAALRVVDRIMESDWDVERRHEAQRWRLKALVQSGRIDEAEATARSLLVTAEDPEVVVEARQVLGFAAFDKLRALVEAHPRWMDDDEVFPQRNALFHEAIDHFLYGSLFHGALRESAATGIWQACEVYRHAKLPEKAGAAAEDLLKLYPDSTLCADVEHYLSQTKPSS